MIERREHARDKMIYSGGANLDDGSSLSERGIQTGSDTSSQGQRMALTIARRGRSLLTRIGWWRDTFVGMAFGDRAAGRAPVSDLDERVRISEKKKRQLEQRIDELLGQR